MSGTMSSMMYNTVPSRQEMMETAGQLIDRALQEDLMYLDLADLLRIPAHNQPNVSGLQDFDYPSLIDASVGLEALPELSDVKRSPLPLELVERFGRMQCRCMMGLFPEIERAWLSVDSDIFIWRFEDGRDLSYFDGLTETILTASLAPPKPGIFQPHIHFVLCLATAADIVLLGVSFQRPENGSAGDRYEGEMHLLPDPLFALPTDKLMHSITATDNGRIFLAGKDGCLYELAYQAEEGWFGTRCKLVNHSTGLLAFFVPAFLNLSLTDNDPLVQIAVDNSRLLVYTRSEGGMIQVYDLGADGQGMRQVTALPLKNIVQHASHIARTVDRSNFKQIVHIAPLTRSESTNIHLVAITDTGVRLYFTTTAFGNFKSHANILALVHVRLPPGFSANASPLKPTKVHMAYHRRGSLLLASSQTESEDLIWATSCDSFPFHNQLMETQTTLPVDGTTWAICELPYPPFGYAASTKDIEGRVPCDPPVVVTQHVEMTRKFVILNSQGSHIVHKMRPVDQLRQLLLNNQGPDNEQVKAFFKLHKVDQACATSLLLACSLIHSDQKVSDWAYVAYLMYGGEPVFKTAPSAMQHGALEATGFHSSRISPIYPPMTPNNTALWPQTFFFGNHTPQLATPSAGFNPQRMSTPVPNPFAHGGGGGGYVGGVGHEPIFSGKHNGVCIYLGRILRPIWESYVVTEIPRQTPQGNCSYLTSTFKSDELNYVLEQTGDLRDFVRQTANFDTPSNAESVFVHDSVTRHMSLLTDSSFMDDHTRRYTYTDAQKMEKSSFQGLEILLCHICEVLGLLKVLVDHQLHILAAGLTKDQQDELKAMTFRRLMINGRDMYSALISCLISRYLDDNATINAISSMLREICPSLYSRDDAVCSKANELLHAAKTNPNLAEKREKLKKALEFYKDVGSPLSLPMVCNQFASVHYYEGIVDLCLTSAQKQDLSNLALHYYKSGEPPEDTEGMQFFMRRQDCYNCILETLGYLLSQSTAHPQAPSVPQSPGPPPVPDPDRLSNVEAEKHKERVFRMALRSEDELFHVSLYEWLVKKNLSEQLLQIESPFLEPFLKSKAGSQAESPEMRDMLWKYYEKTRNFTAAARILTRLAERHGNDVSLNHRVEYLSRAIICAKSSTTAVSSKSEGEFLHELEEKMEVAKLQMQVCDAIGKLKSGSLEVREALNHLNSDLFDVTELYQKFADHFRLFECKLAIVHCAGLHDSALVEDLWECIIDREFLQSASLSAGIRMARINGKLVAIGKLYVNTEQYFPLAFIARYLERMSCEVNFDSNWTYRTLIEIGVNISKLHETYDRMFKSKDPFWQTMRRPLHFLQVIHGILHTYVESPQLLKTCDRRICHDAIANYLVELQAMSSSEPGVSSLMQSFKSLQVTLDKL